MKKTRQETKEWLEGGGRDCKNSVMDTSPLEDDTAEEEEENDMKDKKKETKWKTKCQSCERKKIIPNF